MGCVSKDDPVDEVMRRYPETIRVFLQFRMKCVGCPVGRLHTVEEASRICGVKPDVFLAELASTVQRLGPP